jgi:hypothetical protein
MASTMLKKALAKLQPHEKPLLHSDSNNVHASYSWAI